ncbi:hypothetical protein GCM10023075_53730 [Streptosporangium album]
MLIDELWPGEPPAQALSTIQGYVSRLRRAPARARTVLRDELGLDLGATLQRPESDMLSQAAHLDPPTGCRRGRVPAWACCPCASAPPNSAGRA